MVGTYVRPEFAEKVRRHCLEESTAVADLIRTSLDEVTGPGAISYLMRNGKNGGGGKKKPESLVSLAKSRRSLPVTPQENGNGVADLVLLTAYVPRQKRDQIKKIAQTVGTSVSKLLESQLRHALNLDGGFDTVMVERNGMQVPALRVIIDPCLLNAVEKAGEATGMPADMLVNDILLRHLGSLYPSNRVSTKALMASQRRASKKPKIKAKAD